MTAGIIRSSNPDLARLENAAESAGLALVCDHQSADEFHRALIHDYLSVHGRRQTTFFVVTLAILAAIFIWF